MQRFIVFLLIFIGSILLGWKIAEDPGFAFFSWKQWSAQMPLWFAVLALIIIFYLGYLIINLLNGVDFSVYRWKNWRQYRRKYQSYSKTNRGLVELIEGNWPQAEYLVLAGISQSDAPLINYLAAAKAANERGEYEKRDAFLRKAQEIAPHSTVAIGLTQANLQMSHGEIEQAHATLNHLRAIAPKQKAVLKMLERVYVHLADWQALLNLLPTLRKQKMLTPDDAVNFEKRIYGEMLNNPINNSETDIQRSWEVIPKKMRLDPAVLASYVKQMLRYPHHAEELETLLASAIKKNWDTELVKLYGLVPAADPVKQLAKAEKWLHENPNNPVLLLTLGRLCMRCQLWGKAKSYLESSLKLTPFTETYAEYGRLLEQLGDQHAAMQSYRDGISHAQIECL
jgi:HemY protein